jgi:hypothetical protein
MTLRHDKIWQSLSPQEMKLMKSLGPIPWHCPREVRVQIMALPRMTDKRTAAEAGERFEELKGSTA